MRRDTCAGLVVGGLLAVGVFLAARWVQPAPPRRREPRAPAAVGAQPAPVVPAPKLASPEAAESRVEQPASGFGPTIAGRADSSSLDLAHAAPAADTAGASIAGSVVDALGARLADASVALAFALNDWKYERVDSAGRFRWTGLAPGNYRLTAIAEGFLEPEVHALRLLAGEQIEGIELRMTAGILLPGRVFLVEDGSPVEGAKVTATLLSVLPGPVFHQRGRWARSGADGRFMLPALVPGLWSIFTSRTDATLTHRLEVVVTGEDAPLEMGLERGATLAGDLIGSDGAAPARGLVAVWRNGRLIARDQTVENGHFRTRTFAPGPDSLLVFARNRDRSEFSARSIAPIEVPGVHRHTVHLLPGSSVAGHVLDEHGRPVAGALVVARWEADGSHFERSDVNGSFAFRGVLPPGAVGLSVAAPRVGAETDSVVVRLDPGVEHDGIVLHAHTPTSIRVTLTRCPVGRALRTMAASEGGVHSSWSLRWSEGETITAQYSGAYDGRSVFVAESGDRVLRAAFEASLGEELHLEFAFEDATTVEGKVAFTSIVPSNVTVIDTEFGFVYSRARPARDGSFRLALAPGSYILQAHRSRYHGPPLALTVPADTDRVAVELAFP